MPKVSVIIPVYNTEKYLRECLDSVVNQTLKDIEIICIDDGSTDNSLAILQEYAAKDNRVKVHTQKNKGSAAARNNGLTAAIGEYVGFVDSDDYISQNYFENLYNSAKEQYADISATNQIILCKDNKQSAKKCGITDKNTEIVSVYDKSKIIIATGASVNKIYKRQFLAKNNIKCLEIKNPAEDNYFTDIAVICANKIAINNNAEYYYVIHNESQTQKLKTKEDFKVFEVYKLIENRILQMSISDNKKSFWQMVINLRKKQDFKIFYDTMSPELKEEFENEAKKNILHEIIISLTSYPARINTVNQTIESLLNQSLKADRVILWLAEEQFPNKEKDLPQQLLDLVPKGLTIDWCEDIKSYKKLIPTLKKCPNAIIVTADDDLLYDKKWLEQLYKAYQKNPNNIHCHRAHYLTFKHKQILPYEKWRQNIKKGSPSANNFCTSGAGVLYPPNCFYKDILRQDLFMDLCPQADDIWFWAMCVLNNKKINVVTGGLKLNLIEGTQETALWLSNVDEGKNDIQLNNIIKHYPILLKKLDKNNGLYQNKLEQLFSIKNEPQRKVLTVLGLKLKLKSKKLMQRNKIKSLENRIKKLEAQMKKCNETICLLQQNSLETVNQIYK